MPRNFCLDSNYAEVATFLGTLRTSLLSNLPAKAGRTGRRPRRPSRWFDIASVDRITPAAALVLAAEFDRSRRLARGKLNAINIGSWQPAVRSVLEQLGLLSLLEIDGALPLLEEPNGDLIVLPMRSGSKVLGNEVGELNAELAEVVIEATRVTAAREQFSDEDWANYATRLYQILLEAMGNVIEHAYPGNHQYKFRHVSSWWMTAAFDRRHGRLTVAIYDQGVSIPVSLPKWREYSQVARLLRILLRGGHDTENVKQDARAVGVAMRYAVSRTGQSHRGKGLTLMANFIDACRGGRLRVVSRCGEYVQEKGRRPIIRSHDVSIGGTLVEWEIVL